MVKASRMRISGAAISIASVLAIFVASCISLSVEPGSTGDPEGSSSSSAASSSSGGGSSSSSSGGGSGSSSSSGNPGSDLCGNAAFDMDEECDDGNTKQGDGCSSDCTTEHSDVCPGTKIDLALGESLAISGTTFGASDKVTTSKVGLPGSNCTDGQDYMGSDVVYQVIPQANGKLKVVLKAEYDSPWIHIRAACPGSKEDELACQYTSGPVNIGVNASVVAGVPYYVVPDSWEGKSGPFMLTLSLE